MAIAYWMVTSTSTPGSIEMDVCVLLLLLLMTSKLCDYRVIIFVIVISRKESTSTDTLTYNLLDNLTRAVQVNETLVDAHLVAVPSLGTLTAGRLARGNAQHWTTWSMSSSSSSSSNIINIAELSQYRQHTTYPWSADAPGP